MEFRYLVPPLPVTRFLLAVNSSHTFLEITAIALPITLMKERFLEHKNYVTTNNHSKSTGAHFNLKGHTVSDMEITIIEKIFSQDHRFKKAKREILQTKIKL